MVRPFGTTRRGLRFSIRLKGFEPKVNLYSLTKLPENVSKGSNPYPFGIDDLGIFLYMKQ